MNFENLKICPYCKGKNLGFSDKVVRIRYKRKRQVCIYCKSCNSYGPRRTIDELGYGNREGKEIGFNVASELWNNR